MNDVLANAPIVPLLVVVAVIVVGWVASQGGKKKKAELAAKIEAGAKVIDVRSKGEFATGHYEGAVNIPVEALAGKLKSLGALDKPLVVYCASGARAGQATAQLKAAGFTDVTNAGGLGSMPR
ncbi:MAG: rhodanese-like domain-containing protein [Spirochaetales bacterium]